MLHFLGPPEVCRGLGRTCHNWRHTATHEAAWELACAQAGYRRCAVNEDGKLVGQEDVDGSRARRGADPAESGVMGPWRSLFVQCWRSQHGLHRLPLHVVRDIDVVDGSGTRTPFAHLLTMVMLGRKGVGKYGPALPEGVCLYGG